MVLTMTNLVILGIDPGLDGVGAAVVDPSSGNSLPDTVRGLREIHTLKTSPRDPLGQRLGELESGIREVIETARPDVVAIEWPRHEGNYRRSGKVNRAQVNKLFCAIGSLLAGVSATDVELRILRASGMPKRNRHKLLDSAAKQAGLKLPKTRHGNPREDEWDAIWVAHQLRSGMYTPYEKD